MDYRSYKLNIDDFKIIKKLGSGGFGSVYLVLNMNTNERLAGKVIEHKTNEKNYRKMVNNEIGTLINSRHPTLVKFIGYSMNDFLKQPNVTIFTELAVNNSLLNYLNNVRLGLADHFYDNTQRQIILVGIARGMMFLHQHHIIHRDLKTGNVLLDKNMHPLIADFGFSKYNSIYSMYNKSECGTTIYMAPEIINGQNYTAKVDVYAFGILMYEVVTDNDPYPLFTNGKITEFNFMSKVTDEYYRPEITESVKKNVKESILDLIKKCWSNKPEDRPTFESLFNLLAYGIEKVKDDIFNDNDDDDTGNQNANYYLDNVDADAVIDYADSIKPDFSPEEEIIELIIISWI